MTPGLNYIGLKSICNDHDNYGPLIGSETATNFVVV